MNQRNVAALLAIMELPEAPRSGDYLQSHEELLADWLASHGVLVPSTLNNGQVQDVWSTMPTPMDPLHGSTEQFRLALERIAKGEA